MVNLLNTAYWDDKCWWTMISRRSPRARLLPRLHRQPFRCARAL